MSGIDTAALTEELLTFAKSKVEAQIDLANGSMRVGTIYAASEAPRGSPECRSASAWFAVVARGYSLTGRDSLGEHWFTVDNGDVKHLSRQDVAVRVDAIEQPAAKSTPGVVDVAEVARVEPTTPPIDHPWSIDFAMRAAASRCDRVRVTLADGCVWEGVAVVTEHKIPRCFSVGTDVGTSASHRWVGVDARLPDAQRIVSVERVVDEDWRDDIGKAGWTEDEFVELKAITDRVKQQEAQRLADEAEHAAARERVKPAPGESRYGNAKEIPTMSAEETLWRKEQAERFATVPNPEALRSLDDYANVPEDAKEMVRHRVRLAERDREVQAALLRAAESGEPVVLTLNRDGGVEHVCKVSKADGWRDTAFAITPGLWGSASLVSSIDCDLLPHVLACRPAASKVTPPLGGHTVMSTDRDDPLFGDAPLLVGCREETLVEQMRRVAKAGTKVVLTLAESPSVSREHACTVKQHIPSVTAFTISPPCRSNFVVHVGDPSRSPQVIACREETVPRLAVLPDPLTQLAYAVQPDAPTEPPTSDEVARALAAGRGPLYERLRQLVGKYVRVTFANGDAHAGLLRFDGGDAVFSFCVSNAAGDRWFSRLAHSTPCAVAVEPILNADEPAPVEVEYDPSIDYPFFTPAEIRRNRLACDREHVLSELRKMKPDRGCLWARVRVEPEHAELIADQLREVGWSVEVDGVGGLAIREVKS